MTTDPRLRTLFLALLVLLPAAAGCLQREVSNPNIIVVGIQLGPNNLDPRMGIDDTSAEDSPSDLRPARGT